MPSFHARTIAAAVTLLSLLIADSTARDLRPSDHGLGYQSLPPTGQLNSPDAMSFFGAASNSSSSPSTVSFPNALNSSSDGSWWGGGGNRHGSDHVRQVLLFGSLVCGITGVSLLTVSGFVYLIRIRSSRSIDHTNNNGNLNSLVPISNSK